MKESRASPYSAVFERDVVWSHDGKFAAYRIEDAGGDYQLHLLNLDTLEDELAKRELAEHGLTVLPLFAGERSPGWRGDATGTIHGIRLSTTPLDMVHALLESVALRLAIVAQQLELVDDVKIMASGGALTRSTAWAQIIADALQRQLYLLDEC